MATRPYDFSIKALDEDTGKFSGYASTFGGEPDSYGDIIAPSAFKWSLRQHEKRGTQVPMLLHHDVKEPVGVWTSIVEDERGLKVNGRLVLEVPKAREALALMKAKALQGLSIGYRTLEARSNRTAGTRELTKVELHEISLVTIPANRSARIVSVNAANINDIREYEGFLRDAGFSKSHATILASAYSSLPKRGGRDARARLAETVSGLRSLAKRISKQMETRE